MIDRWRLLATFAARAVGPGSVQWLRECALEAASSMAGAEQAWWLLRDGEEWSLVAGIGWPEGAVGEKRSRDAGGILQPLATASRLAVPVPPAHGMLGIGSPRPGAFPDDTAELLETLATLAGAALDQRATARLAHDFNNQLTTVAVSADFLLEDMSEDDPRRPDIVEIKGAVERATELNRALSGLGRR